MGECKKAAKSQVAIVTTTQEGDRLSSHVV